MSESHDAALSERNIIYNPYQPGEGWVSAGTGPLGGKKWKYIRPHAPAEPPPGAPAPPARPEPPPAGPRPAGVDQGGPAAVPAGPPPAAALPAVTPAAPADPRDANREQLARIGAAARADLADPQHPMNRLASQLRDYGVAGTVVRSIFDSPEHQLSAGDHKLMAAQHARLAAALRINGRPRESIAHLQLVDAHNQWASRKATGILVAQAMERGNILEHPEARRISDFVAKAIAGANLHPDQASEYQEAADRVLRAMPDGALRRLGQTLKTVTVYKDLRTLSKDYLDGLEKTDPNSLFTKSVRDHVNAGNNVGGVFNVATGNWYMDGGARQFEFGIKDMGLPREEIKNAHGVYAHELTHGLDPNFQFSYGADWKAAWAAEIAGSKRLTAYAASVPHEGFAEFGRALYAGYLTHEELQTYFPKCSAVFQKLGYMEGPASGVVQAQSSSRSSTATPEAAPILEEEPDPYEEVIRRAKEKWGEDFAQVSNTPSAHNNELEALRASMSDSVSVLPDHSRPTLSLEDRDAVNKYTGNAHETLNLMLRKGELTDDFHRDLHNKLSAVFSNIKPFDAPVKVYRGLMLSEKNASELFRRLAKARAAGKTVRMSGYTSTSTRRDMALNFAHDALAGKNAARIGVEIQAIKGLDISEHGEDELLLDHNSHFEVEGIDEVAPRTYKIRLKQVLNEAPIPAAPMMEEPSKPRLSLPMTAAQRAKVREERERRTNTRIPDTVKIPDVLYIAMPGHVADKAMKEGHSGEKKGLLGHEHNRTDSVYVATDPRIVEHYAGMYEGSKIIAIRSDLLDRNKMYFDEGEPPSYEDEAPFDDKRPGYIRYQGRLPANALSIKK